MTETASPSIPATPSTPARNAGGARRGNRNRLSSGLRTLVLGRYPDGCSYVAKLANAMRRQIEAAVVALRGEIGIHDAGLIQSACRHESRALLLQRWLRVAPNRQDTRKAKAVDGMAVAISESSGIDTMQRVTILEAIGRATDSRDRCLRMLGLDKPAKPANPWDALHAQPSQAFGSSTQSLVSVPPAVSAQDALNAAVGVPTTGGTQ